MVRAHCAYVWAHCACVHVCVRACVCVCVFAETPAQQMIAIIQAVMANETPPMAWMVNVKQALQRSADVYRPAYQDLHTELKAAAGLDVSACGMTCLSKTRNMRG